MGTTTDIIKGTVKGTASDLAYGTKTLAQGVDSATQPDPPSAQTVGIEHAQKTAAEHNDMPTIKSTLGMHPVESHFAATGPRHPSGRGIPKDHPALQ
jgi:hypothetical protein